MSAEWRIVAPMDDGYADAHLAVDVDMASPTDVPEAASSTKIHTLPETPHTRDVVASRACVPGKPSAQDDVAAAVAEESSQASGTKRLMQSTLAEHLGKKPKQ